MISEEELKKRKNRAYQNKLISYNKSQLNKAESISLNKLRISNRHINCLRIGVNNTYSHERTKFEAFWYCRSKGWDVITEAIFTNNKRADIYIPFLDAVIEIIETEKKEACIKKVSEYPVSRVIILDSKEPIEKNIKKLESEL